MHAICRRLVQWREKSGLSTYALADRAGISQQHISALEQYAKREKGDPEEQPNTGVLTLCCIADALGVPREYLLFGVVGVRAGRPASKRRPKAATSKAKQKPKPRK